MICVLSPCTRPKNRGGRKRKGKGKGKSSLKLLRSEMARLRLWMVCAWTLFALSRAAYVPQDFQSKIWSGGCSSKVPRVLPSDAPRLLHRRRSRLQRELAPNVRECGPTSTGSGSRAAPGSLEQQGSCALGVLPLPRRSGRPVDAAPPPPRSCLSRRALCEGSDPSRYSEYDIELFRKAARLLGWVEGRAGARRNAEQGAQPLQTAVDRAELTRPLRCRCLHPACRADVRV